MNDLIVGRNNPGAHSEDDLIEITKGILLDTKTDLSGVNTLSIPLSELSTLGATVSTLLPSFRTVMETTSFASGGLYRVANAVAGDTLKAASNGNFWGAMKTADGTSKFAQLQQVGTVTGSSTTVMPINPAIILMAVALHSVEKQLGNIVDMEKQILSFLENEKQSEIEADVEMLTGMITKYKYNWDNGQFITSNHKLTLDMQRTARKNMIAYQKNVSEIVAAKKLLIGQTKVNQTLREMVRKFKYYRLSLYCYSLASLLEILLSGNFSEENINTSASEIERLSSEYRDFFEKGSAHIERLSKVAVESNLLKGVGVTTSAAGKLIGSIPKVRDGQVDEFLQKKGETMRSTAIEAERDIVNAFSAVNNPNTRGLLNNMRDMAMIYNHTEAICFDQHKLYLITD